MEESNKKDGALETQEKQTLDCHRVTLDNKEGLQPDIPGNR